MSNGFVYHIPNHHGSVDWSTLKTLGLTYAFDSAPAFADANGPDGRGVLFASSADLIRYNPQGQEWRKIPKSDAWVGRFTDRPSPGPEDLVRQTMLRGYMIALADDRQWQIPMARAFSESNGDIGSVVTLPQYMGVDDVGNWVQKGIEQRYQELWDRSERFIEFMVQGYGEGEQSTVILPTNDYFDTAVYALQTNYRIGPAEIDLCRLMTEDKADAILLALIDWHTFVELIKKKEASEQCGTTDGNEDDTTAIGLQSVN